MKQRITFFLCAILLFAAQSWGQTWKLSENMTADLDANGLLTISTTKSSEDMPYRSTPYWYSNVKMANSVKTIGRLSFNNCINLTSWCA